MMMPREPRCVTMMYSVWRIALACGTAAAADQSWESSKVASRINMSFTFLNRIASDRLENDLL